ncbi:MAG: SAM-dependent methyltransferase, partial [Desulfuromonas sp.]
HLPERLAEILALLRDIGLEPKRLRMVHSRIGEEASLLLLEARRDGRPGLKVESPLFIYRGGGEYSAEVRKIYGD